ncbi:hypothetical protein [Microvirga massiliensis]|uniref:hypothetical protein n=1 Tax=Microvirga massiliensis TaxID=1033741 RepID=UPI00062B95D8|nr:hypothetical protein [Microvirga massiliensis]
MKLFEIATPSLYLRSHNKHAPSTLVRPGQSPSPLTAKVEGCLEKGRPEGRLSRGNSIFLQGQPVGVAPYIYLVKPIGLLERGSTGWIKMLISNDVQDQPLIDMWVASYWAGADCPTVPGAWEYRAQQVQIIRLVGGTSMQRKTEKWDWLKAV